jgi:hypothetical protein
MHTFSAREPDKKRQQWGPKYRWQNSTEMYIIKTGCKGVTEFVWLKLASSGELACTR